jgi:hypothetical protein
MTVIQSLPILWDLTGETCREITKQTAGIHMLIDTDYVTICMYLYVYVHIYS